MSQLIKLHCLVQFVAVFTTIAQIVGARIEIPEEVIKLYFLEPDGALYAERVTGLTSELPARPTFGESMPRDSFQLSYRCLEQDSARAVYAVQITSGGDEGDLYVYVEHSSGGGWHIAAIRTLALTGIPQMVVDGVTDPGTLTVPERQVYENCRLLLKPDRRLKEYFLLHQDEIELLHELLRADASRSGFKCRISFDHSDADSVEMSEGDLLVCDLNLNAAEIREDGVATISIGGMVDNEVGYLYVPEGAEPPRMDPSRYIYVERITGRWFIFKTT